MATKKELEREVARLQAELKVAMRFVPTKATRYPVLFVGTEPAAKSLARELHGHTLPVVTPRGVRFGVVANNPFA